MRFSVSISRKSSLKFAVRDELENAFLEESEMQRFRCQNRVQHAKLSRLACFSRIFAYFFKIRLASGQYSKSRYCSNVRKWRKRWQSSYIDSAMPKKQKKLQLNIARKCANPKPKPKPKPKHANPRRPSELTWKITNFWGLCKSALERSHANCKNGE